jgi:hypothetical protein
VSDPNEITDREALDRCEAYGREVMGLENPQGKMLEILMEMQRKATAGDLVPEYYEGYRVAMAGFRRLLGPRD